jgi:hypothetical protein
MVINDGRRGRETARAAIANWLLSLLAVAIMTSQRQSKKVKEKRT